MTFLEADEISRSFDWSFDLHSLIVHFPIVFLMVAAGAGIADGERRRGILRTIAVHAAMFGAVSAAIAAFSGLFHPAMDLRSGRVFETHVVSGLATAILAFIGAFWYRHAARTESPRSLRIASFWTIAATTAMVVATLHGRRSVDWQVVRPGHVHTEEFMDDGRRDELSISYVRDIEPIFIKRCYGCHAGEKAAGGLTLDDPSTWAEGGDSGRPTIVSGRADESYLLQLITSGDGELTMPPKGRPLERDEVERIAKWIGEGASTNGRDKGEPWHWAYRAPERMNPPPVNDTSWPANAIDHFVLAKLESEGLVPSPRATPETLIRRVTLDLTGLLPSVADVRKFVADPSEHAYEAHVDRLLASPAWGEHMARRWLDLARYADTHGYEKDGRRVMWPWRDWVIDAFNADMPYDRFTIEQLAGDLLESPTRDQLVATGLHRNTMTNEEGGTDPEEFRVAAVLDRVDTTASIWLGTTMSCAQCHDHKFDPITQSDYYRMAAFFDSDEPDTVVVDSHTTQAAGPMIPVPRREDRAAYDALESEVRDLERLNSPEDAATLLDIQTRRDALVAAKAPVLRRAATPRETHVHVGGDFRRKGEIVTPGVPAAFGSYRIALEPTRLGLARWLASHENPLTARVAVNRLWESFFGRGLVATSADFGTQGDAPTHPALLDWLATEFIRRGLSQKSMARLIVTSSTYRQSSDANELRRADDPDGRLLSRGPRHRLDAEVIRDTALCAAGLLSPRIGGPSVFPPQPDGLWTMIYSNDRWTESQSDDRHRRGLYTFWRRTVAYPSFVTFDAPSREVSCTARPRTNTPLQALVTLNDPAFVECAAGLARRILEEGGATMDARIDFAFLSVLSRLPDATERKLLRQLHDDEARAFRASPERVAQLVRVPNSASSAEGDPIELASWTVVSNVLLNLDEAITKG